MTKIAFFDRDGTLNKEVNYLHRFEDFAWIDAAMEFLKKCADMGYVLAVVSNQSGIARGMFNESAVADLHEQINADLKKRIGIEIAHFEICPHHPDFTGACSCRKPSAELLERIAKNYTEIDKENSFMVGDKISDYEAGLAFGIRSYLVSTGHKFEASAVPALQIVKELKEINL